MLVAAENISLLSKVNSNTAPLNWQSLLFNVIEKGKAHILKPSTSPSRSQLIAREIILKNSAWIPYFFPDWNHMKLMKCFTAHMKMFNWRKSHGRHYWARIFQRRYWWCTCCSITSTVKIWNALWEGLLTRALLDIQE